MIEVTLNQPEFEYDIHSLIKAFYPSEYVGVSAEKKEYDRAGDIPHARGVHGRCDNAALAAGRDDACGGAYLCSRCFRPPGDEEPAETESVCASGGSDRSASAVGNAHGNTADPRYR